MDPSAAAFHGTCPAGVGDPQIATDHPWYPGELACSTFSRLAETQAALFDAYHTAEYLSGYAGPPPVVHLRRGESLRRYLQPGLDDGRTFVFWGRNYNSAGIPGPERSRTWVNQPERMYRSKDGTGHHDGQARYANAVYTYRPDFTTGDYREGITDESPDQVTFEFQSPYVIAATPATDEAWSIYQSGCRNGLVISGSIRAGVVISTDRGTTWQPLVHDWRILRQGEEPAEFWSQSFCWGDGELDDVTRPVQVRFHNSGGKRYRRAEMHLLYRVPNQDTTRVTFHWQDDQGQHTESHDFPAGPPPEPWTLATGKNVRTLWVDYRPVTPSGSK